MIFRVPNFLPKTSVSNRLIRIDFTSSTAGLEKEQKLSNETKYLPDFLHTSSIQKSAETGTVAQDHDEIKNDDTGTFKRYLKLADQLLSTDKKDDDPGSSAA